MIILLLLSLISLGFCRLEILNRDTPHVPGEYIIVYKDDTTVEQIHSHYTSMESSGIVIKHKYSIGSFKGFSASLTDVLVSALQDNPLVKYIEVNAIISINTCPHSQSPVGNWGLSRLSFPGDTAKNKKLPQDHNILYYTYNGTGVNIYMLDTGIYLGHNDFGGRAIWGANFIPGSPDTDENGHGTHCSGIAGGTTYGVAKNATLIAVKVLNINGSGDSGKAISGIQWAMNDNSTGKPKVISMSLSGGFNQAFNDSITAAVSAGIVFAAAAGNNAADACNYTPSSATAALTVAATERKTTGFFTVYENDYQASYSNYGTCVDLFAFGSNIISAWIGSPTASKSVSGTSMATPFVAGSAAVILEQNPTYTPDQVRTSLLTSAQSNLVKSVTSGTPNKLLYNGCG